MGTALAVDEVLQTILKMNGVYQPSSGRKGDHGVVEGARVTNGFCGQTMVFRCPLRHLRCHLSHRARLNLSLLHAVSEASAGRGIVFRLRNTCGSRCPEDRDYILQKPSVFSGGETPPLPSLCLCRSSAKPFVTPHPSCSKRSVCSHTSPQGEG